MGQGRGRAVAHHHVGLAPENRIDQLLYAGGVVLVVSVGVDDYIGAQPQRFVEPGRKSPRQALVYRHPDHVVNTQLGGHLGRAIGAAVVYNEKLHLVYAAQRPRQFGHGGWQPLLLVVAGYLYDQFHWSSVGWAPRSRGRYSWAATRFYHGTAVRAGAYLAAERAQRSPVTPPTG